MALFSRRRKKKRTRARFSKSPGSGAMRIEGVDARILNGEVDLVFKIGKNRAERRLEKIKDLENRGIIKFTPKV